MTGNKSHTIHTVLLMIAIVMGMASCSSTSHLEEDEQLFTGLKPIEYDNANGGAHCFDTQAEVEAALATAPNGALFGSSYYRTIPYGLWIYNACEGKGNALAKWLGSTFGKAPVLMSRVNPELRSSVAESVLQNHGYFQGQVDYDIIYGKPKATKHDSIARPRTAKIAYKVDMGQLYTIDTVMYSNFSAENYRLLNASESLLKRNTPFNIGTLDMERARIYNLMRNNGYYFYKQNYTSFLADTVNTKGKVRLNLHLADSLEERANRKWVIGKVDVKMQRQMRESLTDSISRRILTIHFGGKKPPIRPRVVLADVKLRPGQLFSQDNYEESMTKMAVKGIFSSSTISFTPRLNSDGSDMLITDSFALAKAVTYRGGLANVARRGTDTVPTRRRDDYIGAGVLDMEINCVLDKPYDFTLEANYIGKSSGRMGPGARLGFAKRNAFRGGELLSFNLGANYEFQTGSMSAMNGNNYEISGDLTLSMPKLLLPSFLTSTKRRWQTTPSTIIRVSRETINRSGFFRRHILSAELSYAFQFTTQSIHQFSPLILEYDRRATASAEYIKMEQESPVMMASSKDYFMPKMRYNYRYSSPTTSLNPMFLSLSLTESGNLIALGYNITGKKWDEKGKTAFGAPFAQFLKMEAEWKKTWRVGDFSSLIAHAQAGVMKCLGNSERAPYSEQFYVGGANSIRAFTARSIGPGRSYNPNKKFNYVTNTGDMKLVMNLEYRPRLFGSLYGALFIDAGNVWDFENMDIDTTPGNDGSELWGDGKRRSFRTNHFLNDLALGTGIGIRYDLDFFVLRIDWGFALHTPYDNGKSGYLNMPSFSKGQCLNFAIGYPF